MLTKSMMMVIIVLIVKIHAECQAEFLFRGTLRRHMQRKHELPAKKSHRKKLDYGVIRMTMMTMIVVVDDVTCKASIFK